MIKKFAVNDDEVLSMEQANQHIAAPLAADEIAVATSRFGEVVVSRDKIITMTSPFLGFPESRQFFLKAHSQDSPFMWLQSLDSPELAFVVVQSALIDPQYRPPVPNAVLEELQAANGQQDCELLIILTIPRGKPKEMTANLLGPIILNAQKRLAKQMLLDPAKYNPCHMLFPKEA